MARMEDISIRPDDLPWTAMGDGAYFKLLRYSNDTGMFSIILRLDKGAIFRSHYHLGAGEYLMLKGTMRYGEGMIAVPGDYGYEALEARHPSTEAIEDIEMLYIGHGPVCFDDADGRPEMILDGALLSRMAGAGEEVSFTRAAA